MMAMDTSKMETYWKAEDHINFRIELENFIGFICRKYFFGFKQSTDMYKELRSDVVAALYGFLLGGHYQKTVDRFPKDFGRELNFTNYLYTQIRGELTKFFNTYNKKRKREFSMDSVFEIPIDETYELFLIDFNRIIKERSIKLDDSVDEIYNYLTSGGILKLNNIFQIKMVCWVLYYGDER